MSTTWNLKESREIKFYEEEEYGRNESTDLPSAIIDLYLSVKVWNHNDS